ncbi:PAS domain-containing protein [Streptomyces puniciscabiei]|uniref:PAS domain-containing protein n=1 Tax=Streptomyces puniciscabiei TaxID=164348 RepID=UPI00379ADEEF
MASGDLIMRVDEGGRVTEWSRPAQEMFGWTAEEAVGQSVGALVGQAAADGQWRRARVEDAGSVLVKPVLRGSSLVWEVHAAADAVAGKDLAILQAMFTQYPVGLHVLEDQLRIVRMNSAARGLRDAPTGRLWGRAFTEAYRLANPREEEAAARRALETGRPAVNRLVRGVPRLSGQRRGICSVSYVRLVNARGEVDR